MMSTEELELELKPNRLHENYRRAAAEKLGKYLRKAPGKRGVSKKGFISLVDDKQAAYTICKGARAHQEDAIFVEALKKPRYIKSQDIGRLLHILSTAILKLTVEHPMNVSDLSGSTLNATLQVERHIITANVGDSHAFIFRRKQGSNDPFKVTSLNWRHSQDYPDELEQVKLKGGYIEKGYIWSPSTKFAAVNRLATGEGYSLKVYKFFKWFMQARDKGVAMTRAIGDRSIPCIGSTPSFTHIDVLEGVEAYIINCTDGVTDILSAERLAVIFNNAYAEGMNSDEFCMAVAKRIQTNLVIHGLEDNASVVITPVLESGNPVVSGVADGHGGSATSRYIRESFPEIIQGVVRELFYYSLTTCTLDIMKQLQSTSDLINVQKNNETPESKQGKGSLENSQAPMPKVLSRNVLAGVRGYTAEQMVRFINRKDLLNWAVCYRWNDYIQPLINAGAQVSKKGRHSKTALENAKQRLPRTTDITPKKGVKS